MWTKKIRIGSFVALLIVFSERSAFAQPVASFCGIKIGVSSCAIEEFSLTPPPNEYCSQGQPCAVNKCPGHQFQTIFANTTDWQTELDQFGPSSYPQGTVIHNAPAERKTCYTYALCSCEEDEQGDGLCYVNITGPINKKEIEAFLDSTLPCPEGS